MSYLLLSQLITFILLVLTLTPLSRSPVWWIRDLDFPRLQLCILAAVTAILQLSLTDVRDGMNLACVLISTGCFVYQLIWILPYSRLFSVEVPDTDVNNAPTLSILTANVLTPNRNAPALIGYIRDYEPDLVLTLESDDWWQAQLDVIKPDYPHTIAQPQDNLYGMHVFSKFEISESSIKFLIEDSVPSIHMTLTIADDCEVRVVCVHPAPPSPTENAESSERDAELIMVGRQVAGSKLPVIVTGDLNDVAWSTTTRLFRKVSGLLDPRVGRGMFNTFHAEHRLLRWPLDHLFCSGHFALAAIERLPYFGSDHFALYTRLVLSSPTDSGRHHEGLELSDEDRAQAADKLDAVDS